MLKILVFALALGVSGVAIAQQAQPGSAKPDAKGESPTASSAAGGASRPRCDFMSREEMQMCQRTKKGDSSGARSGLCDVVAADVIEGCLKQPQSDSSEVANEAKDPKQQPR